MEILFLLLLGLAAACALIGVVSFGMALFFLREPHAERRTPTMQLEAYPKNGGQ